MEKVNAIMNCVWLALFIPGVLIPTKFGFVLLVLALAVAGINLGGSIQREITKKENEKKNGQVK